MTEPQPTRPAPTAAPRAAWPARVAAPLLVGLAAVGAWEWFVRTWNIPNFLLPTPSAVCTTLVERWGELGGPWWVTVQTMLAALALAVVGGVALAVVFSLSRVAELSLFPYAVVLQVTPLVALAPLLMVWCEETWMVVLACAWIVSFFPVLASTTVGLRSVDRGLGDLFTLYGASRWQRLRLLAAPSALPYFLAGLRTSVNLSLVGAIVAEFVTGAAGAQTGLASVIFAGQFMQDMPLMFAGLALVSATGIGCYFATHLLSHWLLARWHGGG